MKRTLLVALVLVPLLSGQAVGQVNLGLFGGVNLSDLSG
jgi:hypothetical protein